MTIKILLIISLLFLTTACKSNPLEASQVAIDQTKILGDNSNVLLIESASLLFETVEGKLPSDGEINQIHDLVVKGYLREAPSDPFEANRYYIIKNGMVEALGAP